MKLLWTDDLLNKSTTYNLVRGQYGMYEIRYSGTAQSGKTVALSDLGNCILNWNGDDKINVDVDLLSQLGNEYGGAVESESASGGAFAFSIFIPAGYWFDRKNVFSIGSQDKARFKLDFPLIDNVLIASGNVSIYGKPQKGIQSYFHKILSKSVVAGGSGVITDNIEQANIISLYVKNPSALVTDIQLAKDNINKVDGDVASELAYSNWVHLVETSTTLLAIEFAESGNIREAVSKALNYQYRFSGAGNLAQYYSAIEFTPDKQASSAVEAVSN